MGPRPLDASQHDGAPRLGDIDRCGNRSKRFGSHVHDDIRTFAMGQFAQPFDNIFIAEDCFISTELTSKRKAMRALTAGDDKHRCRACLAPRNYRGQPALACSKNNNCITHAGVGLAMRPANAGGDRLKQDGEFSGNFARNFMYRRIRIEVHIFCQSSPERGFDRCRYKATSSESDARAANPAAPVIASHASAATATSKSWLDCDTIAHLQT